MSDEFDDTPQEYRDVLEHYCDPPFDDDDIYIDKLIPKLEQYKLAYPDYTNLYFVRQRGYSNYEYELWGFRLETHKEVEARRQRWVIDQEEKKKRSIAAKKASETRKIKEAIEKRALYEKLKAEFEGQ